MTCVCWWTDWPIYFPASNKLESDMTLRNLIALRPSNKIQQVNSMIAHMYDTTFLSIKLNKVVEWQITQ